MLLKIACCLALTIALVAGAPRKAGKETSTDRLAGLYIKDTNENGEVRFLGGTGTGTINSLITQKQDLLEQLRPTTALNGGNGFNGFNGGNGVSTPIIVNLNGAGTGGGLLTSTAGTGGTAIAGVGGGVVNGNGNGNLAQAAINTSPIGNLLPQIVAQGVFGGGATANRRVVNRRGGNRRRVNQRRRGTNNRRRQVYVIRPGQL